MEKREDELRVILQEGAAAIREMRRGMENACAGLQDYYSKALSREIDKQSVLNPLKVSESGKINSYIHNFKGESHEKTDDGIAFNCLIDDAAFFTGRCAARSRQGGNQ